MSAYARAKERTCLEAGHQKLEPTGARSREDQLGRMPRTHAPHEVEIRMERRDGSSCAQWAMANGKWEVAGGVRGNCVERQRAPRRPPASASPHVGVRACICAAGDRAAQLGQHTCQNENAGGKVQQGGSCGASGGARLRATAADGSWRALRVGAVRWPRRGASARAGKGVERLRQQGWGWHASGRKGVN